MSYYTAKNGLAQFWNRDHTRLEWARWVYHHPEQTQKLVEMLLGVTDYNENLHALQQEVIQNTLTNNAQSISINYLQDAVSQFVELNSSLTNQDIDNITGVDLDGN